MNKSSAAKETLINSANEMKHEAHGMQQPRHINKIGEGASTAQRSDSLVQSINQRFPKDSHRFPPLFSKDITALTLAEASFRRATNPAASQRPDASARRFPQTR